MRLKSEKICASGNHFCRGRTWAARFLTLIFVAALIIAMTGCNDEAPTEVSKPANYGEYGSDFAYDLASNWPYRSPGSRQEKQAADAIEQAFSDLGYEPEVQAFTYIGADSDIISSQNIIVRIPGAGFTIGEEGGTTSQVRKTVVIGSHYDVSVTAEQAEAARLEREQLEETTVTETEAETEATEEGETEETEPETLYTEIELPMPTLDLFDGIHNNASGVAVLLTVAKQLANSKPGYNIVIVAFGAGCDGFAGSRAFAASLEQEEIDSIDVMYNVEGIYAGDKVYAHSGQNSVLGEDQKSYEKRRKLYEATDVYYENELYTNNLFALYTNQSGIRVPWGDAERGQTAIYREWARSESDHTPFDQLGIPIVFFQSYDYDTDKIENIKESSNPAFAATNGVITGTAFDSSEYLANLFELSQSSATAVRDERNRIDILTRRINNVAFIIEGGIKKGLHNAIDEK
ncbi:MAG: M28 family peptidase [Clostridiaceae bacterium]|nr:M28 family peptidase [Clostridiaceae bacterium]